MEELKNCPFCRAPGQMKTVPGKIPRGWVGCPRCGIFKQWTHDPSGAIRIWNHREGLFPLEVGDQVFFAYPPDDEGGPFIAAELVTGVGYEGFMLSEDEREPRSMAFTVPWSELNTTAFRSREEAEAALLAMGGGV